MNEKLRKFLGAIESNEELRERIVELEQQNARKAMEKVIGLAAEYGCQLTEEDFEVEEGELSEEDLGAISGGYFQRTTIGGKQSTTTRKSQKVSFL